MQTWAKALLILVLVLIVLLVVSYNVQKRRWTDLVLANIAKNLRLPSKDDILQPKPTDNE